MIVSSAGLFTALVIVGMIAAIVGVWKAVGALIVCQHSFVKHPVARDHDGKYKNFELKKMDKMNMQIIVFSQIKIIKQKTNIFLH